MRYLLDFDLKIRSILNFSSITLSFGHCAGVENNAAMLENTDQKVNELETRVEDLENLHSKFKARNI